MRSIVQFSRDYSITAFERFVSLVKCAAVRAEDFDRTRPVLVYQMGKVGSLTVHAALRDACTLRSVYHVHFLTADSWNRAVDYYKAQAVPRLPEHMYISRELMRKMSLQKEHRWTIVTLVRDPIARDISGYFQHLRHRYRNMPWTTSAAIDTCLHDLRSRFESLNSTDDYTSTWMDRELGPAFDIDVYSQSFDQQAGCSMIRSPRADLLILETSKLCATLESALETYLGVKVPGEIRPRNVTVNSPYGALYGDVVARFHLPRTLCERIYSTKFARHFFSSTTLASLTDRWAED